MRKQIRSFFASFLFLIAAVSQARRCLPRERCQPRCSETISGRRARCFSPCLSCGRVLVRRELQQAPDVSRAHDSYHLPHPIPRAVSLSPLPSLPTFPSPSLISDTTPDLPTRVGPPPPPDPPARFVVWRVCPTGTRDAQNRHVGHGEAGLCRAGRLPRQAHLPVAIRHRVRHFCP